MSVARMRELWGPFRERVDAFYETARPILVGQDRVSPERFERLQHELEVALDLSERLRSEAESDLAEAKGNDYTFVANLLLAVASVDAMLAHDSVAVDPEYLERWYREAFEEGEDLEAIDQSRHELVDEADALFIQWPEGVTGAQAGDRQALIDEVDRVTDELVALAENPAAQLVRGMLRAATAGLDLVAAAHHVDVLSELEQAASKIVNHAPRWLREHAAKIIALRVHDEVKDEIRDELVADLNASIIPRVLSKIAGVDQARARTRQTIERSSQVNLASREGSIRDLVMLESGYRRQTKLIAGSAKWLRRGAPLLIHLIGPISQAAVGGVFFLGAGYVAYGLTDRLDARDLGFADRVEGTVRLVARHLPE